MNQTTIKKISLTILATLACGALMAQELRFAPPQNFTGPKVPYKDAVGVDWPGAPIFSNLGPPGASPAYDCNAGGYYVLGPTNCLAFPEQWIAVSFWTGPGGGTATRLQTGI